MNGEQKRTAYALCAFFTAGFLIGFFLVPTGAAPSATPFRFASAYDKIKDQIVSLCGATFNSCLIAALSGFFKYPLVISAPLIAYRACAVGHAARAAKDSCVHMSTLASYVIITVVIAVLSVAAAGYSADRRKKTSKEFLSYAYSYLLLTGAALTIKIATAFIESGSM